MCLSAEPVKIARQKKLDEEKEKRRVSAEENNAKIASLLLSNEKCESNIPDLSIVTYDQLFKCVSPELKAFIHSRMFETGRRTANTPWEGAKWGDPRKGTVDQANANFDNLLTRAMKVKDKPVILKLPTIDEEEEEGVALAPTVWNTVGTDDDIYKQMSASELNQRQGWMEAVRSEVRGVNFNWATAEVMLQADQLKKHLYIRMDQHLQKRLPAKYWSHWSFRWARRQFSRVALMACLAGHVKKDLDARQVTD